MAFIFLSYFCKIEQKIYQHKQNSWLYCSCHEKDKGKELWGDSEMVNESWKVKKPTQAKEWADNGKPGECVSVTAA